jgi:hypothetical protein
MELKLKKVILSSVAVLTYALSIGAANAGVVELSWDAQGMFKHEAEIKAGGILEVCGKLPAKLNIDWSFKSSPALESNIHFHQGKKVVFPAKHEAKESLSERFVTKVAKDYCWMWANRSDKMAQLSLNLTKVK